MSLVVHHYYPLGSGNVGDHLVARALHRSIRRHWGDANFVPFPVNDRYAGNDRAIGITGENVERNNREADLVLVGGSNLLEPRRTKPRGLLGRRPGRWGVFTDLESLGRLRAPTLLVGMGTGSDFRHKILPYAPPASDEIRLLHHKAFAATVRDRPTSERLQTIGVHVECTGCPVTFMTDRPIAPFDANAPLFVSLPPTELSRFALGRRFLWETRRYLTWLKKRGERFVVTLHDERDLKAVAPWIPAGVEIFYSRDVEEIVDRYESCRGVIGFRLHAALLGMGLGKPVIPVGIDWRGLGFIQTFGLGETSIRARRLGQFQKLRGLTSRLLDNDELLIRPLARAKQRFQDRHHAFLALSAKWFLSTRRAA